MPSLADEFAKDAGVKPAGKSASLADQFTQDLTPQAAPAADNGSFTEGLQQGARDFLQPSANILGGGLRGASAIGSFLIDMAKKAATSRSGGDRVSDQSLTSLVTSQKPPSETAQRNADIDWALTNGLGADPSSLGFKGARLGTEIAGTAGLGGLMAKPVAALAAAAPKLSAVAPWLANALATNAPKLATALETGGFSTGAKAAPGTVNMLKDLGIRTAGGATTGAAQTAAVGEDHEIGALLGGALPGATKALGALGSWAGGKVASMLTPEQMAVAKKIADYSGETMENVIRAMSPVGPTMTGIKPTVPQIFQTPRMSQLQRTAINAGDTNIQAAEAAQNAARLGALGRLGEVRTTQAGSADVQGAADAAGQAISGFAVPARQKAADRVRALFDSVDPFNETRFELPISQMEAQRDKFLGPGTFGTGKSSESAIRAARDIGEETLPAVKPVPMGKPQSLEQAVRAAGGIAPGDYLRGEIASVGRKQSGITGLVSKNGQDVERLANAMHERGFLPDNDPATLIDALRGGNGKNVYAADIPDNAFQRRAENAMGDLPGELTVARPVPYQQVQNLRSSLNEAWHDARGRGQNKEAASLMGMIGEIDKGVERVSKGQGNPGEIFPPDIVQTWRDALDAHAAKMSQFETGPQANLFKQNSLGQARIANAQIPPKFFNHAGSQTNDAESFLRLVAGDQPTTDALKSYIVTDLANQTNKAGAFTRNKMDNWLDSRAGALGQLFGQPDRALLNEVRQGVAAADIANTAGMGAGSNTAQNLTSQDARGVVGLGKVADGILENPAAEAGMNLVHPLIGPAIKFGKRVFGGQKNQSDVVGQLLADPDLFTEQLKKYLARQQALEPIRDMLGNTALQQIPYRAAPIAVSE